LENIPFTPAEIRQELARIVRSRGFSKSPRMERFLRFAVEEALGGRAENLKEYLLGVEVFDRKSEFDPRVDPIVRVEARRLRSKLAKYYRGEGKDGPIRIDFPTGSYAPRFVSNAAAEAGAAKPRQGKRVAVLPFANLSAQPESEYFSNGLTTELIHALTKMSGLLVLAWPSAARYKERSEELMAEVVVEGSVRHAFDKVRITVQVIETGSGAYLWSETYDREMRDILAVQEEIAHAIAGALQLRFGGSTKPARREPDLAAYHLYLKGRHHWNKRTAEGLRTSVGFFEEAIAKDPEYARAYAGLADAWSLQCDYGLAPPMEVMPKAKSAALRAIELDSTLAEAYVSLGFIRSVYDWEWKEAEAHYGRAIELNPGYAAAHHWYSIDYLALIGRLDQASEEIALARQLDPLSEIIKVSEGYLLMLRREFPKALAYFENLVRQMPGFYKAHTSLGRVHGFLGRFDEAIRALEKGREIAGELPTTVGALGQIQAQAGNRAKAVEALGKLERLEEQMPVPSSCFALIHVGLGNHDQALDYMERACARRELPVASLKVHPAYDALRRMPRFQTLLRRVGLAGSFGVAV
jgi:serine/threonine-protein kinase